MLDFTILEIFKIGFTLGLAFGLQSLIGFGGGLLGLPILLGLDYTLPQSIQILAIGGLVQSAYCSYSLRFHIDWRVVRVPMLSRLIFLLLGIYTLFFVADFDKAILKQLVGVAILAFTLFTFLVKPVQRERVASYYGILAGSLSGFLTGLIGMGGPPLAFWVLSHKWGPNAMKVAIFAICIPSYVLQILVNISVFKSEVIPVCINALMSTPIEILGMVLGLKLSNSINQIQLRRMMFFVLILIGVKAVVGL